jgi:hypothetical protein
VCPSSHLPELHDEIKEVRGGGVPASWRQRGLEQVVNGDALSESLVKLFLPRRESAAQVHLNLQTERGREKTRRERRKEGRRGRRGRRESERGCDY